MYTSACSCRSQLITRRQISRRFKITDKTTGLWCSAKQLIQETDNLSIIMPLTSTKHPSLDNLKNIVRDCVGATAAFVHLSCMTLCLKLIDAAGGHGAFVGYINSLVHSVMYTYYFVTSMWPEYRGSIWWKKHITQLQMVNTRLLFSPDIWLV